jgi:tetratricopeptide (TPR) repeat protein
MLSNHPTVEDFEGFLRNASDRASAKRNTRVIRHLLANCALCQQRLSAMGWGGGRLERLLQLPGADREDSFSVNGYDYAAAFAGAERKMATFLATSRPSDQTPEELMAELDVLSLEEQLRRVSEDRRFASSQLVRWLVEGSHASRYEDPEKMLHLANLARLASEACTADDVGSEPRLADLRARAHGLYGNALRVCSRMREAEAALNTAHQFREAGTGDPPLRARLLEQTASLCMFQRQLEKAIELAEEAGQIYRDLGETHQLASTLVQKAIFSLYSGEAETAAHVLNQAIPLIDHEGDPQLLLAACHNLVRCYIDLDRPEQALSLYFEARELYKEFSDTLILLRAGWQEGQLLRDLGHLQAAETALLRSRKGFLERGLPYEVALVSLDLAAVYVKLGFGKELRKTVAETVPIFSALKVGREMLATLLQLQQMADQEHEALELIRVLVSRLEHLPNRHMGK